MFSFYRDERRRPRINKKELYRKKLIKKKGKEKKERIQKRFQYI